MGVHLGLGRSVYTFERPHIISYQCLLIMCLVMYCLSLVAGLLLLHPGQGLLGCMRCRVAVVSFPLP